MFTVLKVPVHQQHQPGLKRQMKGDFILKCNGKYYVVSKKLLCQLSSFFEKGVQEGQCTTLLEICSRYSSTMDTFCSFISRKYCVVCKDVSLLICLLREMEIEFETDFRTYRESPKLTVKQARFCY